MSFAGLRVGSYSGVVIEVLRAGSSAVTENRSRSTNTAALTRFF
jgi:hypothetical protein